MKTLVAMFLGLAVLLPSEVPSFAQDFRKWEAQIKEYKSWLDSLGPNGAKLWLRFDARQRPHRIYLGDEFFRTDYERQKSFVETFSSYLAGHPEKAVIVDLFDATTNRLVGEYGWAGFKLYAEADRIMERVRGKYVQ